MSYKQILNLRIQKFQSYFPQGKRFVIDGKSEIIDRKGVSAPQKRREVYPPKGAATAEPVWGPIDFSCVLSFHEGYLKGRFPLLKRMF